MSVLLSGVHVKWVPCYHGMARVRVAYRGDGLQMWRLAADILNKQSRTAGGLGSGLTTPHHKTCLLRSMYKGLGNGRILWHDPSTGKGV
jgi:hypothetical protein